MKHMLQSRSKTETETDERQQLRSVGKASRSISPESRDNRCAIETVLVLVVLW